MHDRGFTIIELVMVIIVVSILAAVAVPQFARYYDGIKVRNAAVKIASDIRYAQNFATTTQQRSRVNFLTATTYEVRFCNGASTYNNTPSVCNCTTTWNLATNPYSRGNFLENLNSFPGVAFTTMVNNCIEFDSLGRPYLNTTCNTATSCNSSAGATVTVQSGAQTANITVQIQTGMISY